MSFFVYSGALLASSKELSLEVRQGQFIRLYMFLSRHQFAGKYYNIKIADRSYEIMRQFQCMRMIARN
jgi:hypothetical protein